MRITQQMSTAATLNGLQSTYSNLSTLQAQLSSGRQITKPSDNPSGTVTALQLRSQVAQATQYQTNANAATSWLSTVDSTMTSVDQQLQRVRTLVVQGLNSGVSDNTSNQALASEIAGIKNSLLSLANTTSLGRPVFGGTTAGSKAFTADPSGVVTYSGNSGTIVKDVGPSTSVQVNQVGTDVFGADGSNIFNSLDAIVAKLRSGSTQPLQASDLTAIDTAITRASDQQSIEGAATNQVQVAQTNVTNSTLQYQTQLSTLQDIDVANMAIAVQSADTAYNASLATTAKISQTSLLDYLR